MVSPTEILFSAKPVDAVGIHTRRGEMVIKPQYSKYVAELKPGRVSVYIDKEVKNYFVSGGFVFVYGDSMDLQAVEAVAFENLDPVACKAGIYV